MAWYIDTLVPEYDREKEVDYDDIISYIIKELDQYSWLPLATSLNNDVYCINPKMVSDGLTIYIIIHENFTCAKYIEENPNVALSYMSRQLKGVARILGDPFVEEFQFVVEKYRKRHLDYIEAVRNVPGMTLIEVKLTHITVFMTTKESPVDWNAIHLNIHNEKAYWTYWWNSPTLMYNPKKE